MIWAVVCSILGLVFIALGIVRLVKHAQSTDSANEYVSAPLELRTIPGFLSEDECVALKEAAVQKGMKRSTVVTSKDPTAVRTSSTAFLTVDEAPVVGRVYAKVASLLGVDPMRFEDIQVIRYTVGQEYKEHYDPCFRCTDGGNLLREFTVLMYLNDDYGGGFTEFPLAKQSVAPVKGSAAVFKNLKDGKIIRESKHRSTPITHGVKWAATVWVAAE